MPLLLAHGPLNGPWANRNGICPISVLKLDFHSSMTRSLPPELQGGLPFLGHAREFHRDPAGLLQRGRDKFGEIFSFLLAGKMVTALTGPQANEAFFRAPDDQLS